MWVWSLSQTGSKSVPLGLRKMRGHLSHFLAVLKPPNMSFMKKCFVQFQFSWYWASLHNSSWFYKNSSRACYAYNLLTHCWQKTDRNCCDFPNLIQLICNINRWKHKPTTPMILWPILPFLKLDINFDEKILIEPTDLA